MVKLFTEEGILLGLLVAMFVALIAVTIFMVDAHYYLINRAKEHERQQAELILECVEAGNPRYICTALLSCGEKP